MGRYWYFAATLPTPQLGSPPPLRHTEYLERCGRHLRPRDHALVAAALLTSPPQGPAPATRPSALLGRYYAWERGVRNELARLRSRALEQEPERYVRPAGRDDTAARVAAAVFATGNPLEAELLLERERWGLLRSLAALHVFDLERLAVYGLELQILERLERLRETEGEARYRDTYTAVLSTAASRERGVMQ